MGRLPKPYYKSDRITLYHGDSLELGSMLVALPDVLLTDPIWPNGARVFPGTDARVLLSGAVQAANFAGSLRRIIVILGCDSNPRLLTTIPEGFPFVRLCSLRYVRPSFKGPILYDRDIAYVFGESYLSVPGTRVLPGDTLHIQPAEKNKHPCPRQLSHMRWLVKWYTRNDQMILDPFAGSGTTLVQP